MVSKEWEPAILDSLADICRLTMSQGDSHDFDIFNNHLDAIRKEWTSEWSNHFDKYKKLGDSNARTEHLQKLERWLKPDCPFKCSLAHVDDQDLPQQIADFFQIHSGINICDAVVDVEEGEEQERPSLFTKPPALHWTQYPREAEMQVSFKFTFPQGSIPEQVKVTVVRSASHVIEVSGRIDKDEAAEEEEESETNNYSSMPLSKVWPYLVRVVHAFLMAVNQLETLPYTLNMIFIGQPFFNCPEGARIVTSRSLDAIQTLSAIQRTQSVRFKVDQYIYSLNLDQSFPGKFKPMRLADFSPSKFVLNEPKVQNTESNSISPSSTSFDKETLPTTHEENHLDESGEPRLSPHNLHVERQISGHKNRGRRVSFGAIRAIPTMDGTQPSCTSPLLMGITNHRDFSPDTRNTNNYMDEENDTKSDNDEVQSSTVVEYVDEMLQKAIDEVLIKD
uniref:Uncharacterized protein n=1 Tax=Ditylenchus dipsaci TaxID=166011 RepID=A0A915CXL4_9BILA